MGELLGAVSSSKCVETKVSDDGKVFVRRGGGRAVPMLEDRSKPRGMKRTFDSSQRWGPGRKDDDPTCWDWKNKGHCPRGASCRYVHDPKDAPPGSPAATGQAKRDAPGDDSGEGEAE